MCLEIRRDIKIVSNLNSAEMFSWSLLKTITSTVHSFQRVFFKNSYIISSFFLGLLQNAADFVVRDQALPCLCTLENLAYSTSNRGLLRFLLINSTPPDYSTIWFSLGNNFIGIFLIWYTIALHNCHHIYCKTCYCWTRWTLQEDQ